MDEDSSQEYVAVWSTTDSALLPLIRSVLTAGGVPHVVHGEESLGLFPIGAGGSQSTFRKGIAATILVPRDRREEAERLIRESARTDG